MGQNMDNFDIAETPNSTSGLIAVGATIEPPPVISISQTGTARRYDSGPGCGVRRLSVVDPVVIGVGEGRDRSARSGKVDIHKN